MRGVWSLAWVSPSRSLKALLLCTHRRQSIALVCDYKRSNASLGVEQIGKRRY